MRFLVALLASTFVFQAPAFAQSCATGATTSISGVVYAPNGTDPLPNVLVYVSNTGTLDKFTPGVSCQTVGQTLPGSPTVGTVTAVDGSFSITNVPVGTSVPLVITSGRWRRQVNVSTTACVDTPVDKSLTRMPRNQSEGEIPKIAIATGSADSVECVLRKVGIDKAEFTNMSGTGRINFFKGSASPGATIDSSTTSEDVLMENQGTLRSYDVLMLPCEGRDFTRSANQLTNLRNFADAGGRVYASHYAYSWMRYNPPFDSVANWTGNTTVPGDGLATVVTSFAEGQTLSDWLQLVGASTTPGQISVTAAKRDFSSINPPSQSWLTLNSNGAVMQFVFDTPVGQTQNQCGRVLFNEYHVENPTIASAGKFFPAECPDAAMTPQEKLLEFSLFSLTNGGGLATLLPHTQDFGTEPVNFSTATKPFTWTNISPFQLSVGNIVTSGDFSVLSNNCSSVAAGASCQINVAFKPTAVGARTGTISVGAGGETLTSTLTGTGVADLTVAPSSLDFGSIDVGATVTKSVTVTNTAPGGVPMFVPTATGDFSANSTCSAIIPASSTCTVFVTFKPSSYGPKSGTMMPSDASNAAYSQISVALTGNGLDFGLAVAPTSGTAIAGYTASTVATVTPLAGFAGTLQMTCTTNAPGSTCTLSKTSFVASSVTLSTATMTTTSTYTVVGFGSMGGRGGLLLLALGSTALLWMKRRNAPLLFRSGVLLLVACVSGTVLSGCSGKQPERNANPTSPGSYTYTVTATDGTITHSATYSLAVKVK